MADKAEAAKSKKKIQVLTDGKKRAGQEESESDEEVDFLGSMRGARIVNH